MTRVWVAIVLAGLGTYLIRFTFLALADHVTRLPARARVALRMIPPAALGALVSPALMRPTGGAIDLWNDRLLIGILALLVAWRTKSLFLVITVGLVAVTILENIGLTPV